MKIDRGQIKFREYGIFQQERNLNFQDNALLGNMLGETM